MIKHPVSPNILGFFLLLVLCTACGQKHFITDAKERAVVEQDFTIRKQAFNYRLRAMDSIPVSVKQEALQFLYAYMPIGDITDYPIDFYEMNVEYAFKAKEEMPWGKNIPEREFRHFVLPVRVNNENLDESRKVFYNELKERVKDLSLYDAVLEVNHWCHEKVSYTPSDSRTSSPLASVRTAYGRCGEESTLLVAALRSVSIPARQVYTPRWAHTDDNHAWVEAWVDGKWYFLGACEPEPVLNLGWFNAPASRGMLMHTKVFGHYNGPEEVMSRNENYTEINVIDHYAPADKVTVTVVNSNGETVEGARVEFKLYNYAEFYTVASKTTDKEGKTSLTAGLGDMIVWASHQGNFGLKQCSFGKDKEFIICLDKREGFSASMDLEIVPPVEHANIPEVTPEQRNENNRRMAYEDSLRNAYVQTFITPKESETLAKRLGLDVQKTIELMKAARGNYGTLQSFLEQASEKGKQETAMQLVEAISAKDLRDVSIGVLNDHLAHTPEGKGALYALNVLNPRVANEMITPYKQFFQKVISEKECSDYREHPERWVEWCRKQIKVKDEWNRQSIPVSPIGVWQSRIADRHSLSIFFVSVLRSIGVPARIDEVTGKTQYYQHDSWQDVPLEAESEASKVQSRTLKARYTPTAHLTDPKYYTHFTLSKLNGGVTQLLNYNEADAGIEDGTTWSNLLKDGTQVDCGSYIMVTGTRLAKGNVLARITFFNVTEEKPETVIDLIMRENKDEVQVLGSFNSESIYQTPEGKKESILQTCGRGYYIIGILGTGQEPTNHALRDIAQKAKELEVWGRKMVLLFPDMEQFRKFHSDEFPGLPSNIVYGIDIDGSIQKQIAEEMKLSHRNVLPIFLIADTFNRVVFISQGYTIGLGEQLNKVIHQLTN